MREISVVSSPDREDAQPVERPAKNYRRPADAGPDCCDAGNMHKNERNRGWINDVVIFIDVCGYAAFRHFPLFAFRRLVVCRGPRELMKSATLRSVAYMGIGSC